MASLLVFATSSPFAEQAAGPNLTLIVSNPPFFPLSQGLNHAFLVKLDKGNFFISKVQMENVIMWN